MWVWEEILIIPFGSQNWPLHQFSTPHTTASGVTPQDEEEVLFNKIPINLQFFGFQKHQSAGAGLSRRWNLLELVQSQNEEQEALGMGNRAIEGLGMQKRCVVGPQWVSCLRFLQNNTTHCSVTY